MVVRAVPTTVDINCVWVHAESCASPVSTNGNLFHMPRHTNSVSVRTSCQPPSTVVSFYVEQYYICARSVGPPSPPEEEVFSVFLDTKNMFFSGCT